MTKNTQYNIHDAIIVAVPYYGNLKLIRITNHIFVNN